jgi:hypothetical protein
MLLSGYLSILLLLSEKFFNSLVAPEIGNFYPVFEPQAHTKASQHILTYLNFVSISIQGAQQ